MAETTLGASLVDPIKGIADISVFKEFPNVVVSAIMVLLQLV